MTTTTPPVMTTTDELIAEIDSDIAEAMTKGLIGGRHARKRLLSAIPALTYRVKQTMPITGRYEWVEAADRMPPTSHEPILMWNGRFVQVGKCLGFLPMHPKNVCFYTFDERKVKRITHWALIPALPEPPA